MGVEIENETHGVIAAVRFGPPLQMLSYIKKPLFVAPDSDSYNTI